MLLRRSKVRFAGLARSLVGRAVGHRHLDEIVGQEYRDTVGVGVHDGLLARAVCDASYYANHFAERFAPTATATRDKLALYQFPSCPFCQIVRATIDQLGLDVELRDIHLDTEHRDALIAERGRPTVPVLQIESPDGSRRWMPESRDIVRYLNSTYG